MTPDQVTDSPVVDDASDAAPVLDDALAKLPAKDRDVLVLRFLQQKSFGDLSATIGITEHAAKKRVARALEKLRRVFIRHSIDGAGSTLSVAALTAQLSQTSLISAPPLLSSSISASAHAAVRGAKATGAALAIAKGAIQMIAWLKIRFAIVVAGSALLVAGGTAVVTHQLLAQAASPAIEPTPSVAATPPAAAAPFVPDPALTIDIRSFRPAGDFNRTTYQSGVDSNTKRTPDSPPAMHIKAVKPKQANFFINRGALTFSFAGAKFDPFRGKRVRLTAWVKTKDIDNWAGLQFGMFTAGTNIAAYDMMGDRPIHGTTEWKQYALVEDVPTDLASATATAAIYGGAGEMWIDDVRVEEVPSTVATTDDSNWHLNGPRTQFYTAALDAGTMRDGHPTMCVTSTFADGQFNDAAGYGAVDRNPQKYLGKRIRISVWMKAEGVSKGFGPYVKIRGAADKTLGGPDRKTPLFVFNTSDWTQQTLEANVDPSAMNITMGVFLAGEGKIWIDDFRIEVIGDSTAKTKDKPTPDDANL